MQGKPKSIHVDNGADFHSEALRRGCEVHGIEIVYRPPGQPHFGGIVERVIGTAMGLVHELPGTTFSNIDERGEYNSEKTAALTLIELEKWLALAIAGPYHNDVHRGIMEPPQAKWNRAVVATGVPTTISNNRAFVVDFLPIVRRQIQRVGFVVDHIAYFSNALSKWIANRDNLDKFVIRRDPRDLSRIWVLDPEHNLYLEVPYRTLANPAITLWEHRRALEIMRQSGRDQIDEEAVFRAVSQMRAIVEQAANKSKSARRAKARQSQLPAPKKPTNLPLPEVKQADETTEATPFTEIEEW